MPESRADHYRTKAYAALTAAEAEAENAAQEKDVHLSSEYRTTRATIATTHTRIAQGWIDLLALEPKDQR